MNTLIYDWDERAYHRDHLGDDDTPPTLSASCAKDIILRSPLHAWTYHPRLGGVRKETSDAMDHGTLIHALLLGRGPQIVPVEAKRWDTNDAKAAREAARMAGKHAVLAHKLASAEAVATILRTRMEAQGVVLDGEPEVTAAWESNGVMCRGRFDHVRKDDRTILDIKTCESAHPNAIQRQIENYGYDIQGAAYVEALETVRPDLAGDVRLQLVFCECDQPYAVTVVTFAGSMMELGRRRWARAVRTWKACRAANKWPAYADGPIAVEASDFAIGREAMIDGQ